jgi:hypothetical protein
VSECITYITTPRNGKEIVERVKKHARWPRAGELQVVERREMLFPFSYTKRRIIFSWRGKIIDLRQSVCEDEKDVTREI